MKTLYVLLIALLLVSGCAQQNEGPLERAGARADEIADNVSDGDPILQRKGTGEKVGEAIDRTIDDDDYDHR